MTNIHLLSSSSRPTNTQWHWQNLIGNNTTLQTVGASSNASAIMDLHNNGGLAFVPYYNVLGKSVIDTMRAIAANHKTLQLHAITRMQIEYILAMRKGVRSQDITDVFSHPQALLQTIQERQKIIPHAQPQHAKSTAEGLEIILNAENEGKNIAAVTTPFQIYPNELDQLTIVDDFGPKNNSTYFALLGLKNADINIPHLTSSQNHEVISEEAIKFGVLTIPNYPGSLCDTLGKISTHGINIMSIMSFPQSDGTVIFTIAYNDERLPRNNSPIRRIGAKPIIDQIQSDDNQQFSARIHIPNNSRGSLHRTLYLLKDTINLQEIASMGTGMDTVDFEIKFSLLSATTDDIENMLNKLFSDSCTVGEIILPTVEEIHTILHNLH